MQHYKFLNHSKKEGDNYVSRRIFVTKQEETTTEQRVEPGDEALKLPKSNHDQPTTDSDSSLNFAQELVDYSKRLETCRRTLHLAGKTIKVGTTPSEILHETRHYTLLHYRPMTNKTFRP
jgi:hypothetical protein